MRTLSTWGKQQPTSGVLVKAHRRIRHCRRRTSSHSSFRMFLPFILFLSLTLFLPFMQSCI